MASLLAAGVAFYLFMSLVPTIVASVAGFGLFLTPQKLQSYSQRVTDLLPADAASLVNNQLERLSATTSSSLGLTALIALAVALWGATGGIAQLLAAVNAIHPDTEQRSGLRVRLLAIGLALGAAGVLLVLIAVIAAGQWAKAQLELGGGGTALLHLGRFVVLFGILYLAMTVVLGLGPNTDQPRKWRHIGVPVATIGWVVATGGFSFWADSFGKYSVTWGALAGVVALLMWFWIGVWVTLLAACLQVEVETQTPQRPNTSSKKVKTRKPKDKQQPRATAKDVETAEMATPRLPASRLAQIAALPEPDATSGRAEDVETQQSVPTESHEATDPESAPAEPESAASAIPTPPRRRSRLGPPPPDGTRPPELRRRPPRRVRTPV